MESRWYNFESGPGDDHAGLEKLVRKAEQRYTEVGSELAKHFVTRFAKAKHPVTGPAAAGGVFEKQVEAAGSARARSPTSGWMPCASRWPVSWPAC